MGTEVVAFTVGVPLIVVPLNVSPVGSVPTLIVFGKRIPHGQYG